MDSNMTRSQRTKVSLISAFLMIMAAAAAGCGSSNAGDEAGGKQQVIKVGWVPTLAWIGWLGTVDTLKSPDFKLELLDFKSSSDTLVSMTNGSIEFGAVGYNVLADSLTQGNVPVQYIAGASSKSAIFLARKGAGIQSWADLRGKKVGAVRGSAEYVHLRGALEAHGGLSLEKDTNFTSFNNGTDAILALQRGDIDATVSYEPVASEAVTNGFAENVSAMQANMFSETFEVSSGILASDAFLKAHPDWTKTILKHYEKTTEELKNDPEMALEIYLKHATGDPKTLKAALKNVTLVYKLDESQIRRVAEVLSKAGQLKGDVTEELIDHLNYDYLSEATGKTPAELGKSE